MTVSSSHIASAVLRCDRLSLLGVDNLVARLALGGPVDIGLMARRLSILRCSATLGLTSGDKAQMGASGAAVPPRTAVRTDHDERLKGKVLLRNEGRV